MVMEAEERVCTRSVGPLGIQYQNDAFGLCEANAILLKQAAPHSATSRGESGLRESCLRTHCTERLQNPQAPS
jgi:hypothetical protein